MIRAICTYLQQQGCGTIGTDLFAGAFPSSTALGTAVQETGPEMPRLKVGGVISTAKQVQLLTRGKTYEGARQTARAAAAALLGKVGLAWSGWQIAAIDGVMPQYIGPDEKGFHTFSANLMVYGKETNSV